MSLLPAWFGETQHLAVPKLPLSCSLIVSNLKISLKKLVEALFVDFMRSIDFEIKASSSSLNYQSFHHYFL